MRSSLIGRNDDLRHAESALDQHGVVILVGPSGVGKTAICDVLASDWIAKGGIVHELRGTQGLKDVPFGALTLSLRIDRGGSDAETLGHIVDMLTDSERPSLLVVDDVHLLDEASAGVVSGLAQVADVALALAVTSGESVSADITSVWARWAECRIEVEPLSRDDVGQLLRALLGVDLSEQRIDEIAEVSLGYPLYVTAIAAELDPSEDVESGGIGDLDPRSDRLVSLMERRLARLPRQERRLFDTIAFAESTSARIALSEEDPRLLQDLNEGGLVRVTGDRVQVTHPLLGSVSRGTLTHDGRRASARRLLEGLDDSAEPGDVAAVVRKAVMVGVVPPVHHLQTAAQLALSWGDFEGVSRLTALVPEDPGLTVLRAQASRFLGEVPSTDIPVGLDEAALTEYLSGTSQGIAYGERRFTDAIEFLKEGMASLNRVEHRNRLAMELMVLSGLVGDIDALLGAARAIQPTADPATQMLALSATQLAEALTLSTATSQGTYERGRAVVEENDVDDFLIEQLEIGRYAVELAEGRFSQARALAAKHNERALVGSWLLAESILADAWLPLAEARSLAEEAVSALKQFDPLANLAQARIVADLRRAQQGEMWDEEGGDPVHEEGVAEIDRIMGERVDAWLAWATDDPTAAKRLAEVGRQAIAMGHRFWGLCAMLDATRLGRGEDVASDIEHLVITRGAGISVLAGRYARSSTSDELWDAARMWWEAGAPVYGFEAAIRASDHQNPIHCLGIHILATTGVAPVVGDVSGFVCPVSERQLSIVSRVLSGQTNEEMADDLFISRRTVENHLHRMYRELGMSDGRDEVVERFGWIGAGGSRD